ncbi:putative Protein kinase domain-containing protein [Seiridium cardinale]|uniref:Protein kinase domain-containing protein n=1 Tax=Seiridium cardinale TaxID=138064 RepID=A0ABR2XXZ3_9PEZI
MKAHTRRRPRPSSLEETIKDALVTSDFHSPPCKFLPEGKIDELIGERTIAAAFTEGGGNKATAEEMRALGDHILNNAKKVFATAVMVPLRGYELYLGMRMFKEAGIVDSSLPLSYEKCVEKGIIAPSTNDEVIEPDGHLHPYNASESDEEDPYELAATFKDAKANDEDVWDSSRVDTFCDTKQWLFRSPVFSINESVHYVEENCYLPFTKKHDECDSGTFGRVTKYEIHQAHLIDKDDPEFRSPQVVAVKEMKARNQADRKNIDKTWGNEASALFKMNQLNQPHIVRFYTAFRRDTALISDHYLILEWASGGNLRNLWENFDRPCLTADLVKATFDQLSGLARAINKAHYPESGPNFRHGDLKPENILWFKEKGSDKGGIGTLKIGDWGLAKGHHVVTEMRSNKTTTVFGTRRYEPPEVVLAQAANLLTSDRSGVKRSRLYDIWAFGCIALEFLIWLMYGPNELKRFNKGLGHSEYTRYYLIKQAPRGGLMATVNDIVDMWMKQMGEDKICLPGSTAMGNLLELVRTRLLVVKLPERLGTSTKRAQPDPSITINSSEPTFPDFPSTSKPGVALSYVDIPEIVEPATRPEQRKRSSTKYPSKADRSSGWERARANVVADHMLTISGDDETESYWLTGTPDPPKGPDVDDIRRSIEQLTLLQKSYTGRTELIDADWSYIPDNGFARTVLSSIEAKFLQLPRVAVSSKLCKKCEYLREHILEAAYTDTFSRKYLDERVGAKLCDLCVMLRRVLTKSEAVTDSIYIERDGSSIKANGEEQTVLSIHRSPGNETYFEIIRQWLKHCDETHLEKCRRNQIISNQKGSADPTAPHYLPTRVIDVGVTGDQMVRLHVTGSDEKGKWLALSHQWGTGQRFCTTTENLDSHIKGISCASLPATFRHAVEVTRALNCPYLWIDSLCIVQEGSHSDFDVEAKNMEQVYSGAYCVLASSRTPGHDAGFLQARKERATIALQKKGHTTPFYISEPIDNFNLHVLEGSLNKRGWVLQEHALARRTLYFTDYQTYFECGDGVRSETMGKTRNELAAFLGDPNFSQIIERADRGEKILRYQDLYKRYSLLGLSQDSDRPLAIGSLQDRIQAGLGADGGYGVFDEGSKSGNRAGLLRRSLLWRRDGDTSGMARIAFPRDRAVPSWSWMAHTGGIDYISPPFGGVDWEKLKSPWSSNLDGSDLGIQTDMLSNEIALVAEARGYNPEAALHGEGEIILDRPGGSQPSSTKCIVLGIKKGLPELKLKDRMHYLLVVTATKSSGTTGIAIHERVGAGYLPGKCIESKRDLVMIH